MVCPRPKSCDTPRALMSITPNLCCDKTEPRSIHSPDICILICIYIYIYASHLVLVHSHQCRRLTDTGLTPGLGRSPGGRHGNPLQCSYLENTRDRGAWRATVRSVAKSQTWLSYWACIYREYTYIHTLLFIYTYNIIFNHEKEENPAICNNINGTWGHYAKVEQEKQRKTITDKLSVTCAI